MSIEVLVAIIGILGGVIGGLVSGAVQYVVTARQDQWKYKVETQTEAYRALMDAIADLSLYNGSLTQAGVTEPSADQRAQLLAYQTQLAAAHTKIALYASPAVMKRAGTFFSRHATMQSNEDVEGFIDMIEAMREDSFAERDPEFRKHLDELMLRKALKA